MFCPDGFIHRLGEFWPTGIGWRRRKAVLVTHMIDVAVALFRFLCQEVKLGRRRERSHTSFSTMVSVEISTEKPTGVPGQMVEVGRG